MTEESGARRGGGQAGDTKPGVPTADGGDAETACNERKAGSVNRRDGRTDEVDQS
jgi:hypothetical protein